MKNVGINLANEFGATLKFNSMTSSIPSNQINEKPPWIPTRPHQFERSDQADQVIFGKLPDLNSSKEKRKGYGLGCINLLYDGVCEDREICPHSHNEKDLQETCRLLMCRLAQSKYNKVEENEINEIDEVEDEDDGFIVNDEDECKSENNLDAESRINKRKAIESERQYIIKKTKVENSLYDSMQVQQETYLKDFDQMKNELNDRVYEESNILSKDTWDRFVTKFNSEEKAKNILIIGSIHQAEIEFLQNQNFKIKILESRSLTLYSIFDSFPDFISSLLLRPKYLVHLRQNFNSEYIVKQFDFEYFSIPDATTIYISRTISNDFCLNIWINKMMLSGNNCEIFGEKQILKQIIRYCKKYVDGKGFYGNDSEKLDRNIYVCRLDQR